MIGPVTATSPHARRRRWRVRLALAACVLVLAAVAGWLARDRWLTPWLARQLCAELGLASGATVTLKELVWTALGEVELRELHVLRDDPAHARLEFDLRRMRARFSVGAALRGAPDWLLGVDLDGLRLVLRPGPSTPDAAADPELGASSWTLPARLPSLSVRDADLDLDFGDIAVQARRTGVVLSNAEDESVAQRVRLAFDGFRFRRGTELALEGALEARLSWEAPRLALEALTLDGVERARASWLDLPSNTDEALRWRAELAICGGWLAGTGSVRRGELEIDTQLTGLELRPLLRLILNENAPDLAGTLDGQLKLGFDAQRAASLRIGFAGRARAFTFADRQLDELEVDAVFESSTLRAQRVKARRGTDRIEVRELVLPLHGSLRDVLMATRGTVELETSDLPGWLRVEPSPSWRPVLRHALDLSMQLSAEGILLERGHLLTAGGRLNIRPSSIAWGPDADPLVGAGLDVGFDVDFADLSELGQLLTPDRPWRGSLHGSLEVSGTGRTLVGQCALEGRDIRVAGWELETLETRATLDEQQLVVESLEASSARGNVALRGAFDVMKESLRDVRLSARTKALQSWLPTVLCCGELELEARLNGAVRDPSGDLSVRARGLVPVADPSQALETVEVELQLEAGRVAFTRLAARAGALALEARARLSHVAWAFPWNVDIDALDVRDAVRGLALESPARISLSPEEFVAEDLRLGGSAGRMVLSWKQRGSELTSSLEVLELDAQPLLSAFLPTWLPPDLCLRGLRGRVDLERGADHLDLGVDLEVDELRLAPDQPMFAVRTRAALAAGRLTIENFVADAGSSGRIDLSGSIPLDVLGAELLAPGALDLHGRVVLEEATTWTRPGSKHGLTLAGGATLSFDAGGSWSALAGDLGLDIRAATLSLDSDPTRRWHGPFEVRARGKLGPALELSEFRLSHPGELDVSGSGRVDAALDLRRCVREGAGFLLDAPLALKSHFAIGDLSIAARWLDVRRLGGRLEGDLEVSGSARAPRPEGRAELTGGELRLRGDLPALQAVRARVRFEGQVAELETFRGELGGGELTVSGTCDFSGADPELAFRLSGKDILVVQQSDLRVRADADFSISGPLHAAHAVGRLNVRDGRYTKNVEFLSKDSQAPSFEPDLGLFSMASGPPSQLRFDVDIGSAQPFRLVNNLVRGAVRIDLHIGGTGRSPELTGSVFVDPTRVLLPAAILQSTGGTIRFERDAALVPRLDLRFQTRSLGYDITILVEGTATEPEVELSSSPPLPSADLLALVLTGKAPSADWNSTASDGAARNMAVFLGKDVVGRWINTVWEDGTYWTERVEWRSGANVTNSGAQTRELSLLLLGADRGAGRALYLRGELDEYDTTNIGLRLVFRMR